MTLLIVCISVRLSVCPFICLPVCLSFIFILVLLNLPQTRKKHYQILKAIYKKWQRGSIGVINPPGGVTRGMDKTSIMAGSFPAVTVPTVTCFAFSPLQV